MGILLCGSLGTKLEHVGCGPLCMHAETLLAYSLNARYDGTSNRSGVQGTFMVLEYISLNLRFCPAKPAHTLSVHAPTYTLVVQILQVREEVEKRYWGVKGEVGMVNVKHGGIAQEEVMETRVERALHVLGEVGEVGVKVEARVTR